MSQEKAQLIAPIGHFTVPGLNVSGVVTATSFSGNCTGTASSIAKGTNVVVGVMTASSFVGDVTGNVTGIGSNTDNLDVGIVTATSFAGNFTGIGSGLTGTPNVVAGVVTATKFVGNTPGTVSKLADGTNINVGVVTATKFVGNTSGLAGGISAAQNINVGVLTATGGLYGDGSGLTGAGSTAYIRQTVTASVSAAINLNLGNVIYFVHDANATVSFANTTTATDVTIIRTLTDNTLTWPSGIVWNGGIAPTLVGSNTRSTAGQVFNLVTSDGGSTWYGYEEVDSDPQTTAMMTTGYNQTYGVLGDNSTINRSSPIQIPGTNWLRGSKGSYTKQAFKTDGTMWAWGLNDGGGSIGDNTNINRSSPIQIPGTDWSTDELLSDSTQYQTGNVKTDGTLWMWGENTDGQLGLNNRTQYSSPVQVPGISGVKEFQAVGSYYRPYSGLIKSADDSLWLWGNNYVYQFGLPGNRTEYSSPVQLPGTWSTMGLGEDNAFGISTNGELWSWGSNVFGRLGQNSETQRQSPVQVPGTNWLKVYAGMSSIFATKTDGSLWCWGVNQYGDLGLNDRNHRSSPTQIPGTWGDAKIQVSDTSIAVQKSDGTLWSWGQGYYGNHGLNDIVNRSSPTQVPGNWVVGSLAMGGGQSGSLGWSVLKQTDS